MPIASFHPEDMYKGGFGVQEGMVEVVEAKAIVYQFPPNKVTGEQQPPACYVLVSFQPLQLSPCLTTRWFGMA